MGAMAETLTELGKVGELAEGAMKRVDVGGREILLARVNDKYYAADARCPHMGGDLAVGKLEGTVVTCPRHHSQFDLADGHVLRWTDWTGVKRAVAKLVKPPRAIKVYPVKVEGDRILADI
ncbi:MAG: Rieske 2Fe-2S domain-containing protein [Dehalococcoidia bacterium]|nr:Rieske 2Fe-2S domain-containing protein [Dehalococcoidia bacterium]